MRMEKNKILSKLNINIKDYNNELEKILENKLFSYSAKNLLLSMLYKIENAYRDYETVKVEVPSKKEFIENILRIIKEKVLKIFLVKPGTPEAEVLEKEHLTYKVDRANGEITCIQNERVILTAILRLEEEKMDLKIPYDYIITPFIRMVNQGKLDSELEVIRDFNGWSWEVETKEITDIDYNFMYQTIILLNGRKNVRNKKNKEMTHLVDKLAIQKYVAMGEDTEYIQQLEENQKRKEERLQLFENKKEFLNQITAEKKEYTKQIEKIDRILNNNDLLKKEYYARNEKLPNKEKIFSVSYLVKILEKERTSCLEKIEECNKIILPKEFVEQKKALEEETTFLRSLGKEMKLEDKIALSKIFLQTVEGIVSKLTEENKAELVRWIYKIRYYRQIPISKTEKIRDRAELEEDFEKLMKVMIKKAQKLKIWDVFTDNAEITYLVLREIFNTKIIKLENIMLQFQYENKELVVEYDDDTVMENKITIPAESVRIKKKVRLFI